VQRDPSEVDVRLWRQREVEILDMPLEEYFEHLQRHLDGFDDTSVPR
jgi:ferric-dicitrate binding protein FerR (iron transport regulator)